MSLKALIDKDLKTALIGGEKIKADTLRGVKAIVLNEEIAQKQRTAGLSDEAIEQLISKEVKKRQESIDIYGQAGRQELVDKEKLEIDILSLYLPKQLSEDELSIIIDKVVAGFGDATIKDMGKIISLIREEVGNSADGSAIAKLVKDKLNKI